MTTTTEATGSAGTESAGTGSAGTGSAGTESAGTESDETSIPTGPVAAVLLGAAIGSVVFGICAVLGVASPTVRSLLIWSEPVGPMSGKSIIGPAAFLLAWLVLHLRLRGRHVDFWRVMKIAFVLLGIAIVFTYPPFHILFHHTLP